MKSPNPRILVGLCSLLGWVVSVSSASSIQPATVPNWSASPVWSAPAHRRSQALAVESDIDGPIPFVPVTPCRIVDTRNAAGPYGGPSIAPGSPRSFALASGPCSGIASTAAAYSLNVTATNTTGTGFVKIYPQGGSSPTVSTLNFVAGETIANAAVVAAGTGGGITVAAAARTDVLIDINGYYAATLNSNEELLVTANSGTGAIRGVNSLGDGVQGQTASGAFSGIYGNNSGGGKGVFGASGGGNGVEGQSTSGSGVKGSTAGSSGSFGAAGVWGDSHDFFGIWGTSVGGDGVHGQSSTASGVYGLSHGAGVWGDSTGFDGVHGHTTMGTASGVAGFNDSNGAGVFGSSVHGNGVFGASATHNGVMGSAGGGSGIDVGNIAGVLGDNSGNYGVFGLSRDGVAVNGYSQNGVGVEGATSTGSFGVFSQGDFGGTAGKYFVEPHPTDPTKEIRYASLEGNEVGTYFRGTGHLAHGHTTIDIPEDFRMVTDPHGLTVQLTPVGKAASLYCVTRSLDGIEIAGSDDIDFDYQVNGVRKAFVGFQPIHENVAFVPRSLDARTLTVGLPAESIRRLIASGILNENGSVNEETAHRMGWDQRPGWDRRKE